MTTIDSDDDIEKLPHIQWDNTAATGPADCMFPGELTPLKCQIAGHPFNGERQTIGMLICRRTGCILKPATKVILGEREIAFYENLKNSHDPVAMELKKFVPRYYGTTELRVFNNRTKFLMLRNITKGMAEPCVIDIKIGFRTWDPLATPEKRKTEELKYAESKRTYGFCITGYQVYSVLSGRLRKYDRDYGKQLGVSGVAEALEDFLNIIPGKPVCKQLVSEILTYLYKIEQLFNMQQKYCFYSSSLLVAYDAQHLRQHCPLKDGSSVSAPKFDKETIRETVPPVTVPEVHQYSSETNDSTFSSRMKKSESEPAPCEQIPNQSGSCNSNANTDRLRRTSPSQFSLSCANDGTGVDDEDTENTWVRVKMIDFTHVFPGENNDLDRNYRDGIHMLIRLLNLIKKSDCVH
ncbi:PREDICTED: inositol polyphosphate multikinase-like [Wasmannia auropunctata]|uniref:inositol polyphosphate multikinase-like n=1 Tax=Wasmannia auropunctata TaxID=64793 RepID=UPI0005ED65BE|nr:PREDICTED: inositol polyphosphate multikinase-like [Wasmannia auropunctata]XP_011694409.1 PREDICTED: inositol polyphosphate multikinase-like [Wasmannia auropunctata]XP_011694410.1 PREDICTED: inositol polyphosphate multikinase-like [Wasmannia auropunctata]XP_011694411.1 PREDICTED: inositol polyphosphate multikinase-like [Wasmannia auropunctata]